MVNNCLILGKSYCCYKFKLKKILGEIYAQLTNLSTAYEVFFHGAMETPDISKQHHYFPETDYTTVEFLALEILTSDEAKKYVGETCLWF